MRTSDEESEISPPEDLPGGANLALGIEEKDRNFLTADFSIRDLDLGVDDQAGGSKFDEDSIADYLDKEEGIFGESEETREKIEKIYREYPPGFFHYEKKDFIEEKEEYEEELEDEYEEEEEEEEEEEGVYSSEPSSPEEKLEDEVQEIEPVELDEADVSLLAEIPPEILGNRDAVIETFSKIKEDERDLARKNRLFQYYVTRTMRKKHEKMTPETGDRIRVRMDYLYFKKLMAYKTTTEEIEARRSEIEFQVDVLENKTRLRQEEDAESFGELLAREREVGLGLIFEKSGRAISEKMMDSAIRRKILRREWMSRDRFQYIRHLHCYEDVRRRLRQADNLGQGMTIMDYEVLQVENESYKEKLEEREKYLEKVASSIESAAHAVAHYKEEEVNNFAHIYHGRRTLELIETEVSRRRKILSQFFKRLTKIRRHCAEKRRQAGMLLAIAVVREMEKTIKIVDDLKAEIESMIVEIGKIGESGRRRHEEEAGAVVTRMTGVTRAIRDQER